MTMTMTLYSQNLCSASAGVSFGFCNCSPLQHFESAFSLLPSRPANHYTIKRSACIYKNRTTFTSGAVDNRTVASTAIRSGLGNLFDVAQGEDNDEEGPIELPEGLNPFEVPEATPLQTAASVVLTGAIAVLLYRSLKRRAKRSKEARFRSSGVQSVGKEAKSEALKALKRLNSATQEVKPNAPPPSALQALLGAIIAGGIAFVLYNFSVTVEASLNSQVVSPNYSIRQITITIRTIINGICYLATCVFAVNSIGLTLYSGQLAVKYWTDIITGQPDSKPVDTENKMEVEVKDDN